MAVPAPPGQSKSFTLYGLTQPGVGPLTSASSAVVTMALLDAAGTVVVADTAATPGTLGTAQEADWTAVLVMPTTEGSYVLRASIAYSGSTTEQVEAVEVRTLLNQGGTTRLELRRQVARRLGDLILCRATAVGTTTVYYDAVNLHRPDAHYRSWEAFVARAAAANTGLARNVQGSTQDTTSITLQPAVNVAFAVGDEVELHGSAGVGWTSEEKHDAINDALRQANGMGGVPISATLTTAFDADGPLLTAPGAFRAVESVEYQTTDGEWHPIRAAAGLGRPGWRVHRDAGTIEIQGSARWDADGASVRLRGYGTHDALGSDEDATLVLPVWVIAEAAFQLVSGVGFDRNPEKALRLQPELRREREVWRRAAVPVRGPHTVGLRGR